MTNLQAVEQGVARVGETLRSVDAQVGALGKTIREIVKRSREEQGLPLTVEDPSALSRIAILVGGWHDDAG